MQLRLSSLIQAIWTQTDTRKKKLKNKIALNLQDNHQLKGVFYMAHEIWENRVFTGRGIPAWHKLGITIDGVATWQDAMLLAGLDWQVEKKPLRDEWGNALQDGFGKDANISGIFRDIDNALLGVVRDRYSTIQNKEAFAWVDALIGQEGAHYDSAGALKGGQTIFCSAHLPSAGFEVIPGDQHQTYLMFTTSHDGSQSAQVKLTDVRVVCNNTLTSSINGLGTSLFIRHTKYAVQLTTWSTPSRNGRIQPEEPATPVAITPRKKPG
jgi:phage/plasmid-like protein (TIGR03299 family)